ncbi:hypothetical protein NDU88_006958 [Pleurodeles waltl]|uniref:Uncharacterized protein n=1 Tax=Pleurodeles waltl TaxID=8319 RepID=A0AAV7MDR3_PLEWA|nr:hypothetical protein NDU88_006958 [Pleurodeles waltl]
MVIAILFLLPDSLAEVNTQTFRPERRGQSREGALDCAQEQQRSQRAPWECKEQSKHWPAAEQQIPQDVQPVAVQSDSPRWGDGLEAGGQPAARVSRAKVTSAGGAEEEIRGSHGVSGRGAGYKHGLRLSQPRVGFHFEFPLFPGGAAHSRHPPRRAQDGGPAAGPRCSHAPPLSGRAWNLQQTFKS